VNTQDDNDQGNTYSEASLKHLEFLQAVIARLATDSFLMKGWALTVSAAIFGFAASHLSWPVATLGLLPALSFWFLDSYFLRQERLFRSLYNGVVSQDPAVPLFSMDPSAYRKADTWLAALFSMTLSIFYGALIITGIILIIAGLVHHGPL
jgi:hypothetical protein